MPGYGNAISGQPVLQPYFDRPLHALFGAAFAAGFVLDGLEEPAFEGRPWPGSGPPAWDDLPLIPPVLVARVRAPSTP